jgi:hypothetical protein
MDWLRQVAKHHTVYIGYVKGMGVTDQAEDIVQEMYIRINNYASEDKCITDGNVNKHYIWRVLYNLSMSYLSSKSKYSFISLDWGMDTKDMPDIGLGNKLSVFDSDPEREESFLRLTAKMMKELHSLDSEGGYKYNQELFFLYSGYDDLVEHRESDIKPMSMRKIESETGITLSSIFYTLKMCKSKLKESLREDWEDWNNGEYERI